MICPHCGHENEEGNKFCTGCGEILAGKVRTAKVREKNQPPRGKKVFILFLFLIPLFLIIAFLTTKKMLNRHEFLQASRKEISLPPLPPSPVPPPSYPLSSSPESLPTPPKEFTNKESNEKNISDTFPVNLFGEWKGMVVVRWVTEPAQLFIRQTGLKLSGEINFENVEEHLEGEIKTDGQFFLKGTSYRRLSGEGPFHLDAFYGKVSKDGSSIAGNYEDAAGNKGDWDVSRVSGNTQKTEQK